MQNTIFEMLKYIEKNAESSVEFCKKLPALTEEEVQSIYEKEFREESCLSQQI